MKNVLMVTYWYPPAEISGASIYCEIVAKALKERGINLHVVTYSPDDKIHFKKEGNYFLHKIPSLDFLKDIPSEERVKRIKTYLEKVITKNKIEVLSSQAGHAWSWMDPTYGISSLLAASNKNIPVVLTVHAELRKEMCQIATSKMPWTKVIGVSKEIVEQSYKCGVKMEKLSVVYPPIDTEKFKPLKTRAWLKSRANLSDNDIVVLYAGRIMGKDGEILDMKGLPDLLKAFAQIRNSHSNAKLLIAAAKPREEKMEDFEKSKQKIIETARLHNMEKSVEIQSFDHENMPKVYNGSDIFVLPTKSEAFGLVYAEAMACRLPVVGTDVGGVPEVIDNGKNGYLVKPGDVTELVNKISILIKSPKKRKAFGIEGRKKVLKNFALKKTITRLIGIYESAIERFNTRKSKSNKNTQKIFFNIF